MDSRLVFGFWVADHVSALCKGGRAGRRVHVLLDVIGIELGLVSVLVFATSAVSRLLGVLRVGRLTDGHLWKDSERDQRTDSRRRARTHNKPVFQLSPLVLPVLRCDSRIRNLLPHPLHRRLAPNIHQGCHPLPSIQTLQEIVYGLVFPVLIFLLVGSERGHQVRVSVYNRRGSVP